jgi:hypothetical protein
LVTGNAKGSVQPTKFIADWRPRGVRDHRRKEQNRATQSCEFNPHGVNNLWIGRHGRLSIALDEMDAFLRDPLKCSLAVKQW